VAGTAPGGRARGREPVGRAGSGPPTRRRASEGGVTQARKSVRAERPLSRVRQRLGPAQSPRCRTPKPCQARPMGEYRSCWDFNPVRSSAGVADGIQRTSVHLCPLSSPSGDLQPLRPGQHLLRQGLRASGASPIPARCRTPLPEYPPRPPGPCRASAPLSPTATAKSDASGFTPASTGWNTVGRLRGIGASADAAIGNGTGAGNDSAARSVRALSVLRSGVRAVSAPRLSAPLSG
jgi:hypothetical protein